MNFLFNKKILLSFLGIAVLAAAGFLWYGADAPSEKTAATAPIGAPSAQNDMLKDTDNDGLKHWEEALWGTEPNTADTDGDGTSDGAEVAQNRNPLVKGPRDSLVSEVSSAMEKSQSATDKFAQDMFGNYLMLKQSGVVLDQQNSDAIVRAALKGVSPQKAPAVFRVADLRMADDSADALRAYGNAFGDIVNRLGKPEAENELVAFYYALAANDPKKLTDLDLVTASYQKVIAAGAKLPVPRGAASAHLELLNSAAAVSASVSQMRLLFSDPLIALAGFRAYEKNAPRLAAALQGLSSYVASRGVIFSPEEPGAVLFTTTVAKP